MPVPLLHFDFPKPLSFSDPVESITAERVSQVIPALHRVQEKVDAGFYAAGFIGYEAAQAFDAALVTHPPVPGLPLLWFGIYNEPQTEPGKIQGECIAVIDFVPETDEANYHDSIDRIRSGIAAGYFYQVNQTFRLRAPWTGSGRGLYRRMADASGGDYCAFLDLGRYQVLSASPELFFHRKGSHLVTKPMKGTRPRGRWTEEDARIAGELVCSSKDRAENLMIVDLLRNDLGRIAEIGSVRVTQLFKAERYPTLWQMISTVEAEISPAIGLVEVFSALFPCGSVTGTPKVSAMKQIAELETSPRGVYCGAVGYITPDQEAVFSVAIRTGLLDTQEQHLCYGVGGGIVWDSTPENEYAEALSKSAIFGELAPAFELLETILWEQGAYVLRGRHLDRLLDSAAYFGYPLQLSDLEDALEAGTRHWDSAPRRVRLLAAQDGLLRLESEPLKPLPGLPLPVSLAKTPVSKRDPFLCHKTTHRAIYEAHRRGHPECFDVLLWNEEEELTEFTIGNLVLEDRGVLWTPPRECGLLAGVLRGELLAAGRIQERVLRFDDLKTAQGLWLMNSVRGLIPVVLKDTGY